MRRAWRLFLAFFRLDLEVVCQMSRGVHDFHDYPDDIYGYPWHMATLHCKRCGKAFEI